jgi:GNAT superfamily N-acetyltransferase
MMDIKTIKLKHLSEFARRTLSDRKYKETAPISLIRAFAQARNPLGDPEDAALVVAYDAGNCVGYHGLLPGYLHDGSSYSKVYWLVTFFVNPSYRGKGIGKKLVEEIQNAGVDLVTTGITKGAEGVYRAAGFKQLGELAYLQLRLERLHFLNSLHQGKNTWIYRLTKRIFYSFALRRSRSLEEKFKYRMVEQLNPQSISQANMQSSYPAFPRDVQTVNWMLAHPWVVSSNEAKKDVENYFFSRVREIFKIIALEIYSARENLYKGFMVLSVSRKKRKTVIKILDFYFHEPNDYPVGSYLGMKFAKAYLADRLEYPAQFSGYYQRQPLLKRLIKNKKRLYLYYPKTGDSPLAVNASKIELNYCDADTAFT